MKHRLLHPDGAAGLPGGSPPAVVPAQPTPPASVHPSSPQPAAPAQPSLTDVLKQSTQQTGAAPLPRDMYLEVPDGKGGTRVEKLGTLIDRANTAGQVEGLDENWLKRAKLLRNAVENNDQGAYQQFLGTFGVDPGQMQPQAQQPAQAAKPAEIPDEWKEKFAQVEKFNRVVEQQGKLANVRQLAERFAGDLPLVNKFGVYEVVLQTVSQIEQNAKALNYDVRDRAVQDRIYCTALKQVEDGMSALHGWFGGQPGQQPVQPNQGQRTVAVDDQTRPAQPSAFNAGGFSLVPVNTNGLVPGSLQAVPDRVMPSGQPLPGGAPALPSGAGVAQGSPFPRGPMSEAQFISSIRQQYGSNK